MPGARPFAGYLRRDRAVCPRADVQADAGDAAAAAGVVGLLAAGADESPFAPRKWATFAERKATDATFAERKATGTTFAERKATGSLARLVLEKVPLLLLTAGSCALTLRAAGREDTLLSTAVLPLASRIANGLVSYAAYLRQFFCPVGLAVIYPWQDVDLPPWKVVGAFLILAHDYGGRRRLPAQRPYFLVGWLWYLGMLRAGDRPDASGRAGDGRPLYLLAADRPVPRLDLGDFR